MLNMILKVTHVQPVYAYNSDYDYRKYDLAQSKDGLSKKTATSFANILENAMQSRPNNK